MPDAFAHCEAEVRAGDKDRFLAALFAPAERRGGLFALYAFNLEIARVRDAIRQPLAGEIRLQWWRDAIAGEARGDIDANPVAKALRETVARYGLPAAPLEALITAHSFDLYDQLMMTQADLESYAVSTASGLFALAAGVLGDAGATTAEAAHHAGIAYAVTGLLRALPAHAARGQIYVPVELLDRHGAAAEDIFAGREAPQLAAALAELRALAQDHLDRAARHFAGVREHVLPAFLPVALVRPTLARLARQPFGAPELPQWRRQWLLWRAARDPRRIAG